MLLHLMSRFAAENGLMSASETCLVIAAAPGLFGLRRVGRIAAATVMPGPIRARRTSGSFAVLAEKFHFSSSLWVSVA